MNNKIYQYTALLAVVLAACQIFIATTQDSEITPLAGLAIVIPAIIYAAFIYTNKSEIRKVAYASLISHLVTYLLVNMSFWAHAFFTASFEDEIVSFESGWYGVLIAMPLFWGFGLMMHTLGALYGKGFEDVEI